MALKVQLLRPDDLLNLQVECLNLQLDTADPEAPALIPIDASQDCYLVITFPPQTIAETAFFEVAPYQNPAPPPAPPQPPPPDPTISEKPSPPIHARLGGPSRLVFRIPASAETRIPYTLADLLAWTGFELNVSPIAAVPGQPTSGQIAGAGSIRAPEALETAIELPYRLILSPNREVTWLHASQAVTHASRTELWHTRLGLREDAGPGLELSPGQRAALRAIWSPDYDPQDAPPLGKEDPDLGRAPMSPYDRHAIVVLTSAFSGYVNEDNTDYLPLPIRAEQFILSPLGGWLKSRGAWDPPYKWYSLIFPLHPKPWQDYFQVVPIDLPRHLDVRAAEAGQSREEKGGGESEDTPASRSAGTLVLPDVAASPVASPAGDVLLGKISKVFLPSKLGFRGETPLSLSEWVHIATLGRDHYVRIVYEGHLYPFGHRAALIKVSERKIRNIDGYPLAYLVQHMFIVVREPVKDYTAVPDDKFVTDARAEFAHYERYMPFKRVRLTTLVTPDIAHPKTGPGHIDGTDFSTWVLVNAGGGFEPFKFHASAEDIAGHQVDLTAALIFIPFDEKAAQRKKVYTAYISNQDWRPCVLPDEDVTYAPRDSDPNTKTDNTTLTTHTLVYHSRELPFNKRYGGFLPVLFKADVRIPAIEQLLGADTTTTIALTQKYQDEGLVNPGGVFAQVVKEVPGGPNSVPDILQDKLPVRFEARQAGGIATPNLDVSCLSRKFGTLAGDIEQAAANKFQPAAFFPPGSAQLFGVLDLAKLILENLTLGDNAPQTQISTQDIPGGKKLVTRLQWTPKIQNVDVGILSFLVSNDSQLTITALLEKPVKLPPAPPASPAEGSAHFSGALTNFSLDFLNVILLKFTAFSFTAENGKKMQVDVKLDKNEPVKFQGDLEFVEGLRQLIPPGLLGDGPSLDINTQRVRAGFAFALPPAAVGVFALKDVSLAAFLELPFSDGKPTFDFAFSERHHPFILTVALFGGGGFFHLQLDTNGIKQLEAALEFGAVAALDIGVASGSVHVMAGIYFAMEKKEGELYALLSGYFRCGGELSVLGLVSVSVEFNLSFTYYTDTHKCKGKATLTVTIEIAFFSKSVELSVEKSFGKGGGDPTFAQLITSSEVWNTYAGAFA
jgi:hypothetical protein